MKPHLVAVVPLALLLSIPLFAQTDPGPRGGAAAAGGTFASVTADANVLAFFNDGKTRFTTTDTVPKGLGPRYNSRNCASCHAQPAVGGTSPATNPEVADATANGATNTVPSFITSTGPVREARFIYFTDAGGNPLTDKPNGNVMPLYTIAGRSDAQNCTSAVIQQPNFASAVLHNNVIFRIPTPLFGTGLIENIDETDLLVYQQNENNNSLGISGTFNRSGNDGTIMRFGWKAQNKSLEIFAGEAYNVEMGVSNELFPQERPSADEEQASGLDSNCKINATPEDHTNFAATAVATPSDTVAFAMFMRLLSPPGQNPNTPGGFSSIFNGQAIFEQIGCAKCHRSNFITRPSSITNDLGNRAAQLFSDLQLHHMGTGLADNIVQGNAGGDQFRTAPLWGLGQRLFFLHDGRKTNLLDTITAHSSTNSEANAVIANWNLLSTSDKQDVLNFLRSL